MIGLSKYNDEKQDVLKNSMMVFIGNFGTSVFASCVVFSAVGVKAEMDGVDFDNVMNGGPGLIFETIPTVFKYSHYL